MKSYKLFFYVAFALLLAACAKDKSLGDLKRQVKFKAESEIATKAVMGAAETGKPQTFWENGDKITVYSSADGASGNQRGYDFSTSLSSSAASAEFTYSGEGCASGNYLAIYPAATAARAVNFTGDGDIYKMAAVDVPSSQTLVAGSFDRNAAVATAYAPEGSTSLSFKNAVALVKFRVSGEGAKSGKITVDASEYISGRFRADLGTTAPYVPVLTKYSQPASNFVDFTIDGTTSFSTDTDYYVVLRPTTLSSGMTVYLNDKVVKTFTSEQLASIDRNTIYNLGTLNVPGATADKVLTFDFTVVPDVTPAWPTDVTKEDFPHVEGGIERFYPLDGTNYSFILADCGQATNTVAQLFLHTSTKALVFNAQKRYLGFPAISGYKLTKVVCRNASGVTTAQFEIVKSISPNTDHPATSEIVSAAQVWSTKGIEYSYILTDPVVSTRYYLYCISKGSIGAITLTYEPA